MATPQEILGWLEANPGATDAQIFQAMQQNNVSPAQLAQVVGLPVADVEARYNAQGAANVQQQMSNQEKSMYDWLMANPGASDPQIFQQMQQNGISPKQIASITGMALPEVEQRFHDQVSQQAISRTTDSNNQMRNWLVSNPTANDAQIFAKMQEWGVTPQQLGTMVGVDQTEIDRRYGEQTGRAQSFVPGNQAPAGQTPTGLAGSEQALGAGYESALNSLLSGMNQARTDMTGQSQAAQGTISDAMKQALSGLQTTGQNATNQAQQGFQQAQGFMSPYVQQGQQVNPLLQALMGGSGQAAFDQAFTESPVQQFLLERGNRNVLANSAATGGLGGGNVQKELTRFGQGVAGQSLQQQIDNLMGLSNQGFNAAGNASNLAAGGGQFLSGITQNTGQNMANTLMSGAGQISGIQNNLGQNLGNMSYGGGQNAANYAMNTGQNLSAGRTQAGRDLANAISGVSTGMSNIAQNQGNQFSNVYGTASGNLANLLSGSGLTEAQIMQWLAGNQAQTAQNASGQAAGVPNTALMPANMLQQVGQVAGGVGTLLGAL